MIFQSIPQENVNAEKHYKTLCKIWDAFRILAALTASEHTGGWPKIQKETLYSSKNQCGRKDRCSGG